MTDPRIVVTVAALGVMVVLLVGAAIVAALWMDEWERRHE